MIRSYDARDLDAAVALLDLASPVDTRMRWRRLLAEPGVSAVVAERDGRVVGAGLLGALPDYRGQRPVRIGVAERSRGRGIGTALASTLAHADRETTGAAAGSGAVAGAGAAAGAARVRGGGAPIATTLRDDLPEGRRFAERWGLSVYNHCTGWTIALDDAGSLGAAATEAAARAGVRLEVSTMGECRPRFVTAAADSLAGMPSDTPIELEAFAAAMPDRGVVLFAVDHDGTAGVCLIREDGHSGGWHTSYTGVSTRYRRRGVARALKLASFVAAAERGGTSMHGENDDRNAPMLALSSAVGMRRGLGYWSLAADALTAP